MDCKFDVCMASGYKSHTQIARVLTESWAEKNLFCPRCGNPKICRFPNNRSVADFFCPSCRCEYELKSKSGTLGRKIADGAYDTFIQRITSNNNPDFFILSYDAADLCVNDLLMVPKHFFVPEVVEKRRPLSSGARRAGWIGCNILFDGIPQQGKIHIIENRIIADKSSVISNVQRVESLYRKSILSRGWLLDVLNCVNAIPSEIFSLGEVYQYEPVLQQKHPDNVNIRPKIRQQLQFLRNRGLLDFLGNGVYRKIL